MSDETQSAVSVSGSISTCSSVNRPSTKRPVNFSISHPQITCAPFSNATRDEGEPRLEIARDMLRCIGRMSDFKHITDEKSESHIGHLLTQKKSGGDAATGGGTDVAKFAYQILMNPMCSYKPKVRLVRNYGCVISPDVADSLPQSARAKCVCLRGSSSLMISRSDMCEAEEAEEADQEQEGERVGGTTTSSSKLFHWSFSGEEGGTGQSETNGDTVQVIITLPKALIKSNRDATLYMSMIGEQRVLLDLHSCSGMRKRIVPGDLGEDSRTLVRRLFTPLDRRLRQPQQYKFVNETQSVSFDPPTRPNSCPDFIKEAIAKFVERKLRLHVLCSASSPNRAASRPVVIEYANLYTNERGSRCSVTVRACLHPASSSCICSAYGNGTACGTESRVDVVMEMCGRRLEKLPHFDRYCCRVHKDAIDETTGEARMSINNMCCEHGSVHVACFHRNPSAASSSATTTTMPAAWVKTMTIQSPKLNDADRMEIGTILAWAVQCSSMHSLIHKNAEKATTDSSHGNNSSTSSSEWKNKMIIRKALSASINLEEAAFLKHMEVVRNAQEQICDPIELNDSVMASRDYTALKMMRDNDVYRKTTWNGPNKGVTSLVRKEMCTTTSTHKPLKSSEKDLFRQYGHLFRTL